MKVEGTITTEKKFAAGIAGRVRGAIRNCWASIKIASSVPGDATHGGIAGTCTNGTIIENCLAQVAIVGKTTSNCGGIIGWADSNPNIVNCLVISDGSDFDLSTNASRNICRNDGKVVTVNVKNYNKDSYNNRPAPSCYNNYVTNDWGGSNPSVTVVSYNNLADGKICYQLNNDQSRIAWVQTIGTDPFPVPAAFGSGQVGFMLLPPQIVTVRLKVSLPTQTMALINVRSTSSTSMVSVPSVVCTISITSSTMTPPSLIPLVVLSLLVVKRTLTLQKV